MKDDIGIGTLVRATWKGHRCVVGVVVGTLHNDTCWVLKTRKGETAFLKGYCEKVASRSVGQGARKVRATERLLNNVKARSTLLRAGIVKNFGDGDLD